MGMMSDAMFNDIHISQDSVEDDIKKYLLDHEDDIAHEMNDFGCLKDAFWYYVKRNPEK
jgi:hypothetical protein